MRFRDRDDAGRQLGQAVADLGLERPLVLGLPRGGVPVAAAVAAAIGGGLDVIVARKVGAPHQPELGIGAIAEGGAVAVNPRAIAALGLTSDRVIELAAVEQHELDRRVARYRGDRPRPEVAGRDVVVVDDGLATGVTAEAALRSVRAGGPRRLVLAVPVGAAESVARLRAQADEVVCLSQPPGFRAVGEWYDDFAQTTDDQVLALLETP